MKILTVKQPWAAAIVSGAKDVENRTWSTKYRGPVAIHAGVNVEFGAVFPEGFTNPGGTSLLPRGVILGVVDLVDVTQDNPSPWALPENFHWKLANPRTWPGHHNIEARGALGLRDLPYDLTDLVITALAEGGIHA